MLGLREDELKRVFRCVDPCDEAEIAAFPRVSAAGYELRFYIPRLTPSPLCQPGMDLLRASHGQGLRRGCVRTPVDSHVCVAGRRFAPEPLGLVSACAVQLLVVVVRGGPRRGSDKVVAFFIVVRVLWSCRISPCSGRVGCP